MAKPVNTGDRDYGRRMYTSKKPYNEQRKWASDTVANRFKKHSEFKKPYLPDSTYPEMESYDIPPFVPHWPGEPPGTPTEGPTDPGGPELPVDPNRPKKPLDPLLGCMFLNNLPALQAGEHYVIRAYIKDEDPIVSVSVEGQAKLTWGGPTTGVMVLWINKNINMNWRPLKQGNSSNDPLFVQITATTRSGEKCFANGFIEPCPPEILLEWDWVRSAQTIVPSGSAYVFITGGKPPYTWSISGGGLYFYGHLGEPSVKNNSTVMLVVHFVAEDCAWDITVTDSCQEVANGSLRSTSGRWTWMNTSAEDSHFCKLPGLTGELYDYFGWQRLWQAFQGKYKQYEQTSIGGGTLGMGCTNPPGENDMDCSWTNETFPVNCFTGCVDTDPQGYGCTDCLVVSNMVEGYIEVNKQCYLGDPCPIRGWQQRNCFAITDLVVYKWIC